MSKIQRVREYFQCASEPVTKRQVINETGISCQTVKGYIRELVTSGFIMQIGVDDQQRNQYVCIDHVQNNDFQPKEQGRLQTIIEFINNASAPFSSREVSKATGVAYRTVIRFLHDLVKMQKIQRIEKYINTVVFKKICKADLSSETTTPNIDPTVLIRNYIKKTKSPFTVSDVVDETNIFFGTVKSHLQKMVGLGIISKSNDERREVVYMRTDIPKKELPSPKLSEPILSFVKSSIRPFTTSNIAEETGLCYATIMRTLMILVQQGAIRQIGTDKKKKVYVVTKHSAKQRHYTLEYVQEAYSRQLKKNQENRSKNNERSI